MKHPYIALVSLLLLPALTISATYQWKDEDGNTVYSQVPPAGGQAARKVPPPPPPATPTEDAQEELKALQQRLDDQRKERQDEAQEREQRRAYEEIRADNCRKARENMQRLQQGPQRLFKENDGSYRRYTVEERNEKIRTAREVIERDCD